VNEVVNLNKKVVPAQKNTSMERHM